MTQREKGLQVVREMMGEEAAKKLGSAADSGTFGAAISAAALDQTFADTWTRPVLDRRERSLVTIAILVALRQPHEFGIHLAAGLRNGLRLEEIEEVLMQVLPYVGFPAVSTALAEAGRVIAEQGLDPDHTYEGHRGLL